MLEKLPAAVGHILSGVRPGLEKLSYVGDGLANLPDIILVSSNAFEEGA